VPGCTLPSLRTVRRTSSRLGVAPEARGTAVSAVDTARGRAKGLAVRAANAAVGTVVSATSSQLVVKTQDGGNVTIKLTGDTTYEITTKGTASDLKTGEQVVVTGQSTDGSITATTVRQGGTFGGFRAPTATPSR
jgi:hypothetical protein